MDEPWRGDKNEDIEIEEADRISSMLTAKINKQIIGAILDEPCLFF